MKFCNGCKETKPNNAFLKIQRSYGPSLYYRCKPCSKALNQKYNRSAKRKKYIAEYRSKNKEKLRQKWLEYYRKNPDKAFDHHLKSTYGITVSHYNDMLKNQDGKCAICGKECVSNRRLSVDHCHDTGQIRGLLCVRCNAGIGNFKNEPRLLKSAIEYLEEWIDYGLA
jgi:hypothetical protein